MYVTKKEGYKDIFHVRAFTVTGVDSKPYFLKTFMYNSDSFNSPSELVNSKVDLKFRIEFKRVPKKFILQVLKWYLGKKITDDDLFFIDEGIKCKYCYSIFG